MIELFGTMASDKVNKYNEIIPMSTMINAYEGQWNDFAPFSVNHDNTRVIGCSKMAGIYLEPNAAYLVNQSLVGESYEENKKIHTKYLSSAMKRRIESEKDKYDLLLSMLGDKLSNKPVLMSIDSVAILNPGISKKMFPSIWEKCDNDGLVPIRELEAVLPGIYKAGDYLLYAHGYFRRSLSHTNSLNYPFLYCLQKTCDENVTVKIALDADMIGLAGTEHQIREYAYWWGPKFNDDLTAIPFGITRYENEHYSALMSPIRQTECGWYQQDNAQTFECEEITDIENIQLNSEALYGCRYVHSMLNSQTNNPCHLDGAIRAYTIENMLHRLECNMNDAGRNTVYTKIWRVDGFIPVSHWKELITHYYRDNHLIGEYFNGTDVTNKSTENVERDKKAPQKNRLDSYIPVRISAGDGIRIHLSISEKETINDPYSVLIRPNTLILPDRAAIRYVESETITLIKYLERNDVRVRKPYCNTVAFNDMVFNFPLFVCDNVVTGNCITKCISDLCNIWSLTNDDRIISYSLRINYERYSISFSFLGHISDFVKFYSEVGIEFPDSSDGLTDWAEKVYMHLNTYKAANQFPPIASSMHNNGFLKYSRIFLPKNIIQDASHDHEGMFVELILPKEELAILEANGITATVAHIVRERKCNQCKNDYDSCDCIKFIDSNCSESFTNSEMLGLFWTTRMA